MMLSEVESWVLDESDGPEADLGPPTDRGPPGRTWASRGAPQEGPPGGPSGSAVDLDDFLGDYEQPQTSLWATGTDVDLSPLGPGPNDGAAAATVAAATAAAAAVTKDRPSWPLLQSEEPARSGLTRSTGEDSTDPRRPLQGPKPPWAPPSLSCSDKPAAGSLGPTALGRMRWVESYFWDFVSRGSIRGLCREVYSSVFLSYLYVFVLLVNGWVLLRWLSLAPVDGVLVAAETFVSFMLIFEVTLRSIVLGPTCFSSCAHIFDCAVTAISVTLFINSGDLQSLFRASRAPPVPRGTSGASGAADDFLRELMTTLRIVTQVVRLVPLAMHQKRAKLPQDGVDFSRLDPYDDL
ncbi:hypothetical protein, conserved [Eimeria tenella]|uniref:Ion transport domain-containing protein n=1 Tax=Eimeria tenella TaxID=5802 RepID=U6KXF8_EIMTE|nr:hypothetical protein, conserved [Eimeria tenella]CDJ40180.1 hypothetical protein, conserved [Eimeria tenella]|eukprot:XP_013230933.1 hypothetical protein, conserved [Eimeria tenella]